MHTDLTFITNEKDKNLLERFKVLIKDTRFFDVLVGYFYTSGFHAIYKSLEPTEKIRILIGINTDKRTYDLIQESNTAEQANPIYPHSQINEDFSNILSGEMEYAKDSLQVEDGVYKFIDWLKSGKLQIKAYPSENIHAKLYILTFAEGDRDMGRVITGSSNFTKSGFIDNLEFNVELKNRSDYDFALAKFNELWENAVDVKEKYLETIDNRTWLNNTITPYELYLKFLYEYFKDDLSISNDVFLKYVPPEFKELEYQKQAVLNAKKILNEYGGVFISDVVGLGKTYVAAMLAQQLDGRHLVIAPPILLDEYNPGSWKNVFNHFNVAAKFESLGKLDKIIEQGTDQYKNVFIDEAHRFRSETNMTYEQLAQICRGKRVILVTATPLNNTPRDILSQIKLFQKAKNSTIPNIRDLERFFTALEKKLKGLDRQKNYDRYMAIVKENAKEIRDKIIKYIMVRRTRTEILNYFKDDLRTQNIKFPEVENPEPVLYELDDNENRVFMHTIELAVKKFKYSRYRPMFYYEGEVSQPEKQAQENIAKFMKILLIKRLESSFYAFRNTLKRFMHSYEQFINEFKQGNVYVSKKYSNKIFELLEDDNDEAIQRLIEEDKAQKYSSKDFRKNFIRDLEDDLAILCEITKDWESVNRDPKFIKLVDILSSKKVLKENKLIIFTESKETAEYLEKNLQVKLTDKIISFTGGSGAATRDKVIENFDAKARIPKDDYRILISTEILSEGVNLHRSNVVINYDLPWNPARLMQRVGRINRIDTKFDKIYTFNFFPTQQSNNQIKLREAAEYKIQAFIEMLGADARLLTEGEEIKYHDLWSRLTSNKTITGEDEDQESELKYLEVIREIRDKQLDLFERIKRLPKKARTGRKYKLEKDSLLTYFRKGKIQKFYLADKDSSKELDFFNAASMLEVKEEEKREHLGSHFYELLEINKKEFELSTTEEVREFKMKGGRDSATIILNVLNLKEIKEYKGFTEDQEVYRRNVIKLLVEGALPKQTMKNLVRDLQKELKSDIKPQRILAVCQTNIATNFFKDSVVHGGTQIFGPREVILSEYLTKKM